jgi:polar amino acid transport system permease protein
MTETAADDDCVETNTVEWAIAALVGLLFLRLLWSLMRNENLLPGEVVGHLLHPDVLAGVWLTIRLTALVFAAAWAIGLVAIWMARSGNPVLGGIAAAYVWVFGSIPVLVQLLLWSNIALVFPDITFGIPGVHIDAVRLVTPVYAAIAGLALAMGAYAARALPSGDRLTALGDLLVTTLQMTSLVSVLSITDLLGVVQALEERNHLIIPLLVVAAIWYLVLVTAARAAIRLARLVREKGQADRR